MLQRSLGRGEYAADVDVDHAVHLLQRGFLERFRNRRAGIVHQHIQPAEGRDGLFDRTLDGFGVGSVGLDRNSLSASEFNCFDHGGSRAFVLRVGEGHARSIGSQTFCNRCADTSGTAGNESHFIG
jgi:hypothetical protein